MSSARAATAPKGQPTSSPVQRGIKPTTHRYARGGVDHRPPSGKHAAGRLGDRLWLGTSRIIDRPTRRRRQRASWQREVAATRRSVIAQSEAEVAQ